LKKFKKIAKWFVSAILIIVILLSVSILVAPKFGWRVDAILSGSMEPALNVGGAVIIKSVDPYHDIEVGDIIAYRSPVTENRTCHRVVEINYIGLQPNFVTKGDANEGPDPYIVYPSNVIGEEVYHIPYFGYFTNFARTDLGLILLLVVPGVLIIASEVRNIWKTLSQMEKKKEATQVLSDPPQGDEK
jgi:signal peptidase